ncbi:MAG: glycerophosphodiester phosphodiesterase family protein [Eubacteriales bacterium]|nr:glycerophosphodiester phosphodiesterase family protein [Eubacteriales bacterium]
MNKKGLIACFGVAAVALPLYMIAPGRASAGQKARFRGVNFAHRGLHTRDESVPENSMEAFRLAAEKGYGIELDIRLTKDGYVVVFHDDTLDRVCGISGKVIDYTYSELKEFRLCGSDETIPLFSDVLAMINGRSSVLCELKTCGKRSRELCEKAYGFISEYHGDLCIESFDPTILRWFRFYAPDLYRGQLAAPVSEYAKSSVRPFCAFLLSHGMLNFISRPNFISYKIGYQPLTIKLAYLLRAGKFAWPSHEPRNEEGKDAVIFEYYKPKPKFK